MRSLPVWFSLLWVGCQTPSSEVQRSPAAMSHTERPLLLTPPVWSANSLAGSLAAAGDINGDGFADIIIGEPTSDTGRGRVVVFYGSASGLGGAHDWEHAGEGISDQFGASVAQAGDVNGDGFADIIVGAPSLTGQGDARAYLFLGGPGDPILAETWSSAPEDGFGGSVASAGDVNADGFADVIVGAHLAGDNGEGAAWVFLGSAQGLLFPAAWTYQHPEANAAFGTAVASAGDIDGDGHSDIIVGAKPVNGRAGSAHVFWGSPEGIEAGEPLTIEGDATAGTLFGATLSPAGDFNGDGYADVIIGASGYATGAGAVRLYLGGSRGLSSAVTMTGDTNQKLGSSVAGVGDINGDGFADVVVGSPADVTPKITVWYGISSGVGSQSAWGLGGSQFGHRVAGAGDINGDGFADVLVSAPGEQRVYLYLGAAAVTGTVPTTFSGLTGAQLGFTLANAGDINADGFDDLIVGAGGNGGTVSAVAHVLYGTFDSLSPLTTIEPSTVTGWSVAAAGDTNGDGYTDVLIGIPAPTSGTVLLYQGSADGLLATPISIDGNSPGFGTAITAGDVTGDGLSDIIVGAPSTDNGTGTDTETGVVLLYFGGAQIPDDGFVELTAGSPGNMFGSTVAAIGDIDGDGIGDLVIVDPSYRGDLLGAGAVLIFYGNANDAQFVTTIPGVNENAELGTLVAAAGDVDGDGRADFLARQGYTDSVAYLFCGSTLEPIPIVPEDTTVTAFGRTLASAGDVNGDGLGDVVIGSDNATSNGRVTLYLGQRGCRLTYVRDIESTVMDPSFGEAASAGDFNGDGYGDIAIGAPDHTGEAIGGQVSLYWGNDLTVSQAGRPLFGIPSTHQREMPIAPEGMTDHRNGFAVQMSGDTPFGQSRIAVQVEVKKHGQGFDGTHLVTGEFFEPSTGSVHTTVGFLEAQTPYHWRARLLYDPAFGYPQGWSHWIWGGIGGRAQDIHLRTNTCELTGDDRNCNGIDEDCDGSFDNNFVGASVTCGVGACEASGETLCNAGHVESACEPTEPISATDSTCNGIDDNCNGSVDEDYLETETTCGFGPCAAQGFLICTEDGEYDTCAPGPPKADNDTTCDGIDDNCNGFLDEDATLDSCVSGDPCAVAVCNPFANPPDCQATRITACCNSVTDCPSAPCLSAACLSGTCVLNPQPNCCENELDCDDKNLCSVDSCVDGTCHNVATDACCAADADCFDGDPCTFDQCNSTSRCLYSPTSCGTDGPCGDDSSCWYSGAVVSLGSGSPEDVTVAGALPTAVMHIDITTEAIGGSLDALRLNLVGPTSLEASLFKASLFIDAEGDGIDGDTALATASVTDGAIAFEVGHNLKPATSTTFVVALSHSGTTAGSIAAVALALLLTIVAVTHRRRVAIAMACALVALSVTAACTYTAYKLPQVGVISLATNDSMTMTPESLSHRIDVRGAPIVSAPFKMK